MINGKSYPVTAIGKPWEMASVFQKERNLKSVNIPNSVKSIYHNAFAWCSKLTDLVLPDNPVRTSSNYYPFIGCHSLTNVRCQNGSIPTYMLDHLPEDCPFMLAQRYPQAGNNNNIYAQNVQPQPVQTVPQQTTKQPSSDVDVNIPSTPQSNSNLFAVVIANEKYTHVAEVPYANNDAKVFAEYCKKTLGLPENNVRQYDNATYGTMLAAMSDIKSIAQAYDGNINVIFYYSGHGIPNEMSRDAYLLPVDANGQQTEVCYPVSRLYKELGEMGARNVVVFLDACFSGAQRGEGMLVSARGIAIKANADVPKGNLVVFSAATGEEAAFPYKEKEHGMFTYFLLKKLRETKGDCTLGELGQYIQENVRQQSVVVNRKSQTPTIIPSQTLANTWRNLKLK